MSMLRRGTIGVNIIYRSQYGIKLDHPTSTDAKCVHLLCHDECGQQWRFARVRLDRNINVARNTILPQTCGPHRLHCPWISSAMQWSRWLPTTDHSFLVERRIWMHKVLFTHFRRIIRLHLVGCRVTDLRIISAFETLKLQKSSVQLCTGWATRKPMNQPMGGHAAVAMDTNTALVCGGILNGNPGTINALCNTYTIPHLWNASFGSSGCLGVVVERVRAPPSCEDRV